MTKEETIKVLQSIEDRAVDFPYMTACDWVAIASAKRHLTNSIEVEGVDLELENENNNYKITIGTKICLKTNPNVILSIISNDCHEDEFECSNGSVLSLKQIKKYYDIITYDTRR